jgi:Arc/MetJ-type ribon-helix-helix transcriptional regulator
MAVKVSPQVEAKIEELVASGQFADAEVSKYESQSERVP